jgi:hypothetical protein
MNMPGQQIPPAVPPNPLAAAKPAGAITSANLPKPPVPEAFISDDEIVAKPLRPPNFINLLPRNPNHSLYWGNRAVGEQESTLRYDQLIAMGFRNAKPEEVKTATGDPVPPALSKEGKVMYGDLILLLIPRADYRGSQKWNEQSARARVKKPGVAIAGDKGMHTPKDGPETRMSTTAAGFPRSDKVQVYTPQLAEVDRATADNSGPEPDFNLATK